MRQKLPWQQAALAYCNEVPELDFSAGFYARMLAQLGIYPAKIDAFGKVTPTEDDLPVRLLNRVQDPGGGRSQLQGSYGRLKFITGEGILFGRDLDTDDEAWAFVWNDELFVEYNSDNTIRTITWRPTEQSTDWRVYGPDEAQVYRMWTPSPGRSGEARSPMRASLQIAQELIELTAAVMATAVSRTTQGIIKIPMELLPPPAEGGSDEDALLDPLISDFVQGLTQQKEGAGTAEGAAPFFFAGAYEFLDRMEHMRLHDTQNDYAERDLRTEAVTRLARGFDFPPEVLIGLSSANHWAARQILDEMWRSHGAPVAEQWCDDLNIAYLRPALRAEGYADWNKIVIGYDESQIVVRPDRAADALNAHKELAISDEALRKEMDFPDTYRPEKDELDRRIATKVRDLAMLEQEAGMNGSNPQADQGPPPPGPEGDSGRKTRVVASATRELGAAEMALHRCRELAGIRILNQERKCPDCVEAANGKAKIMVAAAIGADNVTRLQLDPRTLVKGGTDALAPLLTTWGYSSSQAGTICEMVELYAARTLFQTEVSLPKSLESQITQIQEIAHPA